MDAAELKAISVVILYDRSSENEARFYQNMRVIILFGLLGPVKLGTLLGFDFPGRALNGIEHCQSG